MTTVNINDLNLVNLKFASNQLDLSVQCSIASAIRELIHALSELTDGSVGPIKLFFDSESTILIISRKGNSVFIRESGIMGNEISMGINEFYEYTMRTLANMILISQENNVFGNSFIFEDQKVMFKHLEKDIAVVN